MTAIAANRPSGLFVKKSQKDDLPSCPVCADTMVAAEASVLLPDERVGHLWSCDTCGYGFVTRAQVMKYSNRY